MELSSDDVSRLAAQIAQHLRGHANKRAFTREQAAEYCGISFYKVANAIRRNQIPAKRHGKDIVVLREDLDTWMDGWEPA
ncbi:helix-turn-helix domain-containing protein [Microbacterium sp. A1-JK]|uniref:helix-turn-helix domain-containing protein n=1 Tax=Microbacterium sp. A1-JK TaxID=3177516 RepID=UPI00388B42C8